MDTRAQRIANIVVLALVLGAGALAAGYFSAQGPDPSQTMAYEAPEYPDVGTALPDFTFTARDGRSYKAADFGGQVILVNFWASWCAPCLVEFPHLLDLAARYPDDMVLIALSSDQDEAAMNRFLDRFDDEQTGIAPDAPDNILIAKDQGRTITRRQFGVFRLPETLIIAPDGMISHKLIGADWSADDVTIIIDQLL